MATGRIIRLKTEGGYGFIRPDTAKGNSQRDDLFVHRSAIESFEFADLEVGMRVAFEPAQGPKGLRAEDVRVLAVDGDVENGAHAVGEQDWARGRGR